MFLEPWSVALHLLAIDSKVEKQGKLRRELEGILGEYPLEAFARDQIAIPLLENDDWQSEPKHRSLLDALGGAALAELTQKIIIGLESLPWSYVISLELPEKLSLELKRVVSSDLRLGSLGLSVNDEAVSENLPISRLPEGLNKRLYSKGNFLALITERGENDNRTWREGRVRIQRYCTGYVDVYGSSKTSTSFESAIKSFFGLCFALRILRYERQYSQYRPKIYAHAHRVDLESPQLLHRYSVSERISEPLDDCLAYYSGLQEEVKQQHAIRWAASRLQLMAPLFEDSPKHQRLLTACAWHFDSLTNEDELLGFVQSMVVIEILLGDDEPSGELTLGALLRNRCAYLISETLEEREKIVHDLKKIYEVRSKIVHRGKSELTITERTMLNDLRSLCSRVIISEFNLGIGKKSDLA